MIGILTKVLCTYVSNLVILAWTADELSCGQASDWYSNRNTHTLTDTQTGAMTIPEGQNWPRVINSCIFLWETSLSINTQDSSISKSGVHNISRISFIKVSFVTFSAIGMFDSPPKSSQLCRVPISYHFHIWQESPQLSICDDPYYVWMWCLLDTQYFVYSGKKVGRSGMSKCISLYRGITKSISDMLISWFRESPSHRRAILTTWCSIYLCCLKNEFIVIMWNANNVKNTCNETLWLAAQCIDINLSDI